MRHDTRYSTTRYNANLTKLRHSRGPSNEQMRKLEITPEHESVALKLQALTRGKTGRKKAKRKRVESKSAIKIQAVTRGKKDRKRVEELKENNSFEKIFGKGGKEKDGGGQGSGDGAGDSIDAMFKKVSFGDVVWEQEERGDRTF